jgi:hypothetical protein
MTIAVSKRQLFDALGVSTRSVPRTCKLIGSVMNSRKFDKCTALALKRSSFILRNTK